MLKKAKVISNFDPEAMERLRVAVDGIHDLVESNSIDSGVWAEHCKPYKYSSGNLPEEGDYVYIIYDPPMVIWLGIMVRKKIDDSDFSNELKALDGKDVINNELSYRSL